MLLANELTRTGTPVHLLLSRRDGALLADLRPEVAVSDLGGRRAASSIVSIFEMIKGARAVYSGTNARNLAVLSAAAVRASAPPILISEHTSPEVYLATAKWPALRRLAMRRLYPRAARLVAPTPGLGEAWLTQLSLSGPPVAVLPNPILTADDIALSARIAAGSGPDRDPDLVVSIGRLHSAKGPDILLDAFAVALGRRPSLRLDLWGEGAEEPALRAQAERLGIAENVRFRGLTSQSVTEIAGAGLFALASRREGFGNVVVEALAAGTPVVATDCDGPRRLLDGLGPAGRIVPRENPDALGLAIAEQAGQAEALAEARQAGPARAERYSVAAAAEAFRALIDEVS
ncbi:glycosyltransferase [Pelagovum pacificum]|nr:glycosyltransferase [Pelagovum pacificum]QQA43554.1 glycosyltransferase [Pelagovum pacificum]